MPICASPSLISAQAIPVGVHDETRARPIAETPTWDDRFNAIQTELSVRSQSVQLLFCGDSLTEFFQYNEGAPVWTASYGTRKALNLGIGGDKTQGLLYRLTVANQLRGLKPKLTVLLIGSNDTAVLAPFGTAHRICDGIVACAQAIRTACPNTKLIILSLLPRDFAGTAIRVLIDAANALLAVHPIIDGTNVQLLDMSNLFKDTGTQQLITALYRDALGPDRTHLSQAGYQVWADAIEPYIVAGLVDTSVTFVSDVVKVTTSLRAAGSHILIPLPNHAAADEVPKVFEIWTTGAVTSGSDPTSFNQVRNITPSYGCGSPSGGQVAYGTCVGSGLATTATRRYRDATAVLVFGDTAGVVQGKLALVTGSMTAKGQLSLSIANDFPEDIVFFVRAWGGTSIGSAVINRFTKNGSGVGTQTVTTGNKPRYVLMFGINLVFGTDTTTVGFISVGRCWIPTLSNQVLAIYSDHNQGVTNSGCYGRNGEIHCLPNPTGGVSCQERFRISAGSDTSFTLDRLESSATATELHYLSVAGDFSGSMGSISSGLTSGAAIPVVTGVDTACLDVWSVCNVESTQDVTTNESRLSIGSVATAGPYMGSACFVDPDGADPTTGRVGVSTIDLYQHLDNTGSVARMTYSGTVASVPQFAMNDTEASNVLAMWLAVGRGITGAVQDGLLFGDASSRTMIANKSALEAFTLGDVNPQLTFLGDVTQGFGFGDEITEVIERLIRSLRGTPGSMP